MMIFEEFENIQDDTKGQNLSHLEEDYYKLLHDREKSNEGTLIKTQTLSEKNKNAEKENILNIIANTFDKKKFVIELQTPCYDNSDLLIIACCKKVLLHKPYMYGKFPGSYKPTIEVTDKYNITELLNDKSKTFKYKSYEYLASYIYYNRSNIDCNVVEKLYERISDEDKLMCNINLNFLSTMIKNASTFEKVHKIINNTNIFKNRCTTPSGSNILMMIFENNSDKNYINDYVKMLIDTDESIKNTSYLINKTDNQGKNIFSYCNFEHLSVESYKSIINLGYDVNNKYMKIGEETNIIFDLVNCIEQFVEFGNFSISHEADKTTNENDFLMTQVSELKYNICSNIVNQLDALKYLLALQSLENTTLELSGTHIVFKIVDIICKIINKLSTKTTPDILSIPSYQHTTTNSFIPLFKTPSVNFRSKTSNNNNNNYKYCIKELNEIICNLLNSRNFNLNYVNSSNESILSKLITETYNTANTKNISMYCKQLIKEILKHNNIDTNHRDDDNKIPLEYAIENSDSVMFDMLRNYNNTNLSALTKYGYPIAFLFIDLFKRNDKQHINMFINLLKMQNFNHSDVTTDGKNLLLYLCSSSLPNISLRLFEAIINTGIDINKRDNQNLSVLDYVNSNKQLLLKNVLVNKYNMCDTLCD